MRKTFKGFSEILIELIPEGKIGSFLDFLKYLATGLLVLACLIPWVITVGWFGYVFGPTPDFFIGVGFLLFSLYLHYVFYFKEITITLGKELNK